MRRNLLGGKYYIANSFFHHCCSSSSFPSLLAENEAITKIIITSINCNNCKILLNYPSLVSDENCLDLLTDYLFNVQRSEGCPYLCCYCSNKSNDLAWCQLIGIVTNS